MKNLLSLASALLLVAAATSSVSAQIGIGLRAGPLISKETFDADNTVNQIVDEDNLTGFIIGVPLEIGLSKVFSLQPEFNYQRRKSSFTNNFDFNGVATSQRFERKLNYFEIPLLLKLGYTSDQFTLAGLVGPGFGYAFGGTQTYSDYIQGDVSLGQVAAGEGDLDFGDNSRDRVEWNGIVGAQIGVPVLTGKLILDGRYQFGLNKLKDGGDETVSQNLTNIKDSFTSKSQGYSITLGYLVTLGDY